MKKVTPTNQFKSDLKKYQNKQKIVDDLMNVIKMLQAGQKLPEKFKDHKLKGQYSSCRDCHIRPDDVFIYEINDTEVILIRFGSHAELY